MNINPFDILKNAQKIQEQMNELQEKFASISVTGSSGGGMVEIDLNGKQEVIAVRIAPETMASGDVEMLQDLVVAAFTDGMMKIRDVISSEVGAMANFPGVL